MRRRGHASRRRAPGTGMSRSVGVRRFGCTSQNIRFAGKTEFTHLTPSGGERPIAPTRLLVFVAARAASGGGVGAVLVDQDVPGLRWQLLWRAVDGQGEIPGCADRARRLVPRRASALAKPSAEWEGSTLIGLALRPGFRLKARSPSIAPARVRETTTA
jgi:hypothetical protein